VADPVLTIRINVTSNLALDGSTEYSPDPDTGVFDPTLGLTTFTTAGPIGVIDLAAIVRRFSQPLVVNAITIKNNVAVHAAGSKASVRSPDRISGLPGNEKTVIFMGNTDGIYTQANFNVPIDHRLVLDTQADGANSGPHEIQITLSTYTGSKFLNRQVLQDSNIPGDPVLSWKDPCRVASTANADIATLTSGSALDGVTLDEGDSVVLKDQTAPAENGIYEIQASPSPAVRRADASNDEEVFSGMSTYVSEGTVGADTVFVLVTPDPIAVGTTGLAFTALSGGGGGGQSNTASNLGGGAGWWKQKFGVDLQFLSAVSADGSIIYTPGATEMDVKAGELGAGTFNGLTYTWPTVAGTFGQIPVSDGVGGFTWQAQTGGTPVVVDVLDNAVTDIIIGDVTAQVSVVVQMSIRIPSLGSSSGYNITAVGDGVSAITTPGNILLSPGPIDITTIAASLVVVGTDIVLRLTGSGSGAATRVTYQTLSTFNV
jgi:hypothetical protein